MSERHPEAETLEEPVDSQDPQEASFAAGEEEAEEDRLAADYDLAQRCVAGEVAAWEELYAQCHDPLLALIRSLLHGCANYDGDLADEIAARVWYALVADDGRLLAKYDPKRGAGLMTFMRAVARDLIGRHFRSECRRAERELVVSQKRPDHYSADLDQASSSLDEFLGTLDDDEREFIDHYLLDNPVEAAKGEGRRLSQNSIWKRTRRLSRRLTRFLGRES